jgi:hypothetical protein
MSSSMCIFCFDGMGVGFFHYGVMLVDKKKDVVNNKCLQILSQTKLMEEVGVKVVTKPSIN